MAVRGKKKQFPCDKEANNAKPWPDLPRQLVDLIAKESTLMEDISFGGISKTWRIAPNRCNPNGKTPWLQLSNVRDGDSKEWHGKACPHIFNITFRQGCYWPYPRWRYKDPPQYFVGYSHGVLVTLGATPSECNYRFPEHSSCCQLPSWDANIPFKYTVPIISPITKRRARNDCILVLTGISFPAFLFYRPGKAYEWIKQECNIVDPHASDGSQSQFLQFTNAIAFKGKFYALSLQGTLAVIEVMDSDLRITALSSSRGVPSVPSRHFREHLIESDGQILLVFLISRKSNNIVDDVEVFRLHLERLSWIKMERLGDRTLFIGVDCCISVSGSKVGCRGNCLYFTQINVDGWWVYDMGQGTISPSWSSTGSTEKSPVWI